MITAIKNITLLLSLLVFIGCGSSDENEKDNIQLGDYEQAPQKESKSSEEIDTGDPMDNKGIGPVNSVDLNDDIDHDMAARGQDIFKKMCSSCHKMDKKFVGPAIDGVTERRSPEWIMNMILNPEQMIKEDPIAKKLLIEHNMAIMADQNVEEDEARALLEYFRNNDE